MRLKPEQLGRALNDLLPVYLLSGDEPLQLNEAADAIRETAKKNGYLTRKILSVDAGFEWAEFFDAAYSLSLFAEKKIIDLRLPTGKIGVEGSKSLIKFCQNIPEDTLLLITTVKLTAATLKSKWCQGIDQSGAIVQIWPLEGAGLIQWLQQRAKKRGLHIEPDGIKVLASRIEGNLLAAAQEIEKLYILHGTIVLSKKMIEEAVADSARFDVFKLTDCVLAGRIKRATKILNSLKSEGIAPPIILWALARDARLLFLIKTAIQQGQNKEIVFKNHRLWDKRKQLINAALSRINIAKCQQALLLSARADRQIKGQEQGDCWETILSICEVY